MHHEKLKKQTGTVEVHTETAKEIVKIVLAKLDTNGDGVLTMREFVAGGVAGLPNFKGVEHLGHHYDAEGEYFLHHEEKFHNTPETQNEEDYVHPEGESPREGLDPAPEGSTVRTRTSVEAGGADPV